MKCNKDSKMPLPGCEMPMKKCDTDDIHSHCYEWVNKKRRLWLFDRQNLLGEPLATFSKHSELSYYLDRLRNETSGFYELFVLDIEIGAITDLIMGINK